MANTLTATIEITGNGKLVGAPDLGSLKHDFTIGVGNFDQIKLAYTNGTSTNQANEYFIDTRTVSATSNDNLDLYGTLTNPFGETVNFAVVKTLIILIDAHDGSKALRVGPQNISGAWQGPWGGTGATVYHTVYHSLCFNDPYTGYTVTATTADILGIYNPGASIVTYHVLIIGEK